VSQPAEFADFFISYNHADEEWAEWVAWQLENADHTTIIQAWDFTPGSNFVLEMDRAARRARRTLAILSPHYLASRFTAPEWAAAFAADPDGTERRLVPVRIAPSSADGLLGQIVWIDLVGRDEDSARTELLTKLAPGRAKPTAAPPFPGLPRSTSGSDQTPPPPYPPAQAEPELDWQPADQPVTVTWRDELLDSRYQSGTAIIELHLVAVPAQHLEVRRIGKLPDELAAAGRASGLFASDQALENRADSTRAVTQTARTFHDDKVGLAVTRTGQRSGWVTLPHDSLGSIVDVTDLAGRLPTLLQLLRALDLPDSPRTAVAARIEPLTLVSVGSVSAVGNRSTSSMPFVSQPSVTVLPDDTVTTSRIDANLDDLIEELLARITTALNSNRR
jgi:hypothetical protein